MRVRGQEMRRFGASTADKKRVECEMTTVLGRLFWMKFREKDAASVRPESSRDFELLLLQELILRKLLSYLFQQ